MSIKYASKEIPNILSRDVLKLLSRNFKYTSKKYQVCYQNNIKLVMHVLQKTGTYSGCINASSIRLTCQSLSSCDITAVGTYWYHSDWLWPLTNRCTNAVFRPLALTGTARSQYLPMESHGRWHLLALQREHANLRVSFCKSKKLTTTDEDHVILWNKQLS